MNNHPPRYLSTSRKAATIQGCPKRVIHMVSRGVVLRYPVIHPPADGLLATMDWLPQEWHVQKLSMISNQANVRSNSSTSLKWDVWRWAHSLTLFTCNGKNILVYWLKRSNLKKAYRSLVNFNRWRADWGVEGSFAIRLLPLLMRYGHRLIISSATYVIVAEYISHSNQ